MNQSPSKKLDMANTDPKDLSEEAVKNNIQIQESVAAEKNMLDDNEGHKFHQEDLEIEDALDIRRMLRSMMDSVKDMGELANILGIGSGDFVRPLRLQNELMEGYEKLSETIAMPTREETRDRCILVTKRLELHAEKYIDILKGIPKDNWKNVADYEMFLKLEDFSDLTEKDFKHLTQSDLFVPDVPDKIKKTWAHQIELLQFVVENLEEHEEVDNSSGPITDSNVEHSSK